MTTITLTDLRCKVEEVPHKVFKELRKKVSYELGFWEKKNMPYGEGHVSMISEKGTFLLGLADDVYKFLLSKGIKPKVIDEREDVGKPSADDIKRCLEAMPFSPRPYQLEQILRCCIKPKGLVHSCTGSGKTYTMAGIISAWDMPTIILVKSKDLMYQLQEEIAEYRGDHVYEIGLLGDGKYDPKRITVAMVQTVTNGRIGKHKKDMIKKCFDECRMLLVDEVHNAQSKSYKTSIRKADNAVVRIGFSATPMTSETKTQGGKIIRKDIVLRAYFGPVIHRVKTRDLIDMGYLADPEIRLVKNSVYFDGVTLNWSEEYDRIIMQDDNRNNLIAKIIAKHYHAGELVIGFVSRIDHGHKISQLLVSRYNVPEYAIGYVTGEDFVADRTGKISDFKEGNLKILLGTVLSEGLNFFCDVGINISGGRSEKNVIQRTGRVLRKKRDPVLNDVNTKVPEFVTLYDMLDIGHPYFEEHGDIREKVYKAEGHKVVRIEEEEI